MNTTELYEKYMFDFLDDGTVADSPERDGFVIDDDGKADWAVRKIKEEQDEYLRLCEIADAQIEEIKDKIDNAKKRYENKTEYYKSLLAGYFETVEHKKSPKGAQESYQLLSGKLVKKQGGVKYDYDDKNLIDYLKANAPDLVAVKESAKWGEFKKRTKLTPGGEVINAETGEVLGFIKAAQQPDTFDVKF